MSTTFWQNKEKGKRSLKIENFDQISEKCTLPIEDNFDQTRSYPLSRGLTILCFYEAFGVNLWEKLNLCRISTFFRRSAKKLFLNILQYSQENICVGVSLQASSSKILLKRNSTTVFSCEYCEIFKNTYFEEHLRTTAS